jgi:phenylpyruvate tautomerase PptA (4-oxalocrotonate tautomerase family)
MTGKGELVKYTRLVEMGPLTPAKKKQLIKEVTALINAASNTITIEVMVEPTEKKPGGK